MRSHRQQKEQAAARQRQMQEMERLRQESIDRVSAEAMENMVDEIVRQESQNMAIIKYR